jgi:hypothetical protein
VQTTPARSELYLVALLADHGIVPPPDPDALSTLTPWATDFRYEDTSGRALDRARVWEMVQGVREWAEKVRNAR